MAHNGRASTLGEVAELAGVSKATASRAINGRSKVSAKAQTAVFDAVRELGYTPNGAARSLVTQRTGSVAVILPESDERIFSDPFFARMLHLVARSLREHDLQLVLLLAQPGDEEERLLLYLRGRYVDGAIVASHHRDDRLAEHLSEIGLPCVFIGRPWIGSERVSFVDSDNAGAAGQAVRVLLEAGRCKIATIAGPPDMRAGHDRLLGWRRELATHGVPSDLVAYGDFTEESGAEACASLLDAGADIDGIFAASDLMAQGAVRELASRGIRVPEDVAIVGYDDLGVAERTRPPLTTLHNPIAQMVAEAVRLLTEAIDEGGQGVPRRVVFVPELVRRDSV
ncbi:LacI family DNA-binding transcriptional regulator [Nocardioides sp. cx-173]|uniref:LacI family DNA-binding transcriptional regulator n=1 Tax=Nocardioides sp. cx-173 TaxID=2898796 RepID=UPI001E4E3B91|nr:LacI family DNA-binding transcriptional regulator [Nocardioides sp. cx-173]MCD4524993.1 LacI family transcriptional regulator [Nocardioides sp. cx-173]UGB40299.1 LacI family transcriptional regulator [Nocardioides sp. cx-173]